MTPLEPPVTREKVRALVEDWADDPATVVEIVHPAFTADERAGGFAFGCDRGVGIYCYAGMQSWSVAPADHAGRLRVVDDFWKQMRHELRALTLGDVGPLHRAAIAAVVAGLDSVAGLPAGARPDDVARADYLLVMIRRSLRVPTEADALRAIAASPWLLDEPGEDSRAHACPVCGRPAIGTAWGYVSVCDDCSGKVVCEHGRRIAGHNVSLSGGFEASHADDDSVCDQVTRDGRVWIGEVEAHMGEAKFGGVFVGFAPAD